MPPSYLDCSRLRVMPALRWTHVYLFAVGQPLLHFRKRLFLFCLQNILVPAGAGFGENCIPATGHSCYFVYQAALAALRLRAPCAALPCLLVRALVAVTRAAGLCYRHRCAWRGRLRGASSRIWACTGMEAL